MAMNNHTIMHDFAIQTGLTGTEFPPRRYLWTDAFAVCNFLQLYQQTGKQVHLELALKLVDQVHTILGHHRADSSLNGWLSGLSDHEAKLHPTQGGLRIGKPLNERPLDEPLDNALEWKRDGQYFHYLTKWMHALNRVCIVTGDSTYNRWAIELAKTAQAAFTYTPDNRHTKRMVWKMSIDLSRPLIASMGQHDPLDGLITFMQLDATMKGLEKQSTEPTNTDLTLGTEIAVMRGLCSGQRWVSNDALGIGGLLTDAYRLTQMIDTYHVSETTRLDDLLQDIEHSVKAYLAHHQMDLPPEHRLAFRELGLAIGLHCIDKIQTRIQAKPENFSNADALQHRLNTLYHVVGIAEITESFWLEPAHQGLNIWAEHADINNVMLATSLAPDGYLAIDQ